MKKITGMIVVLAVLAGLVACYFVYMANAFPENRCDAAKHLANTETEADCYGCHAKATPRVAQEWYESKHGVTLVRCQTCHGMPDGKGSIPFTRSPGVEVCSRCHSAAMEQMEARFGRTGSCNTCHPNHQSPIHGKAYEYRTPSSKTSL